MNKFKLFNLIFFTIILFNSSYSQDVTAEIFSPRIKKIGNAVSFYFRVLNVNEVDFNNLVAKSKNYAGLNTLNSGYSQEYKIGSIYYNSESTISLNQISDLLKFLSLNKIIYDGKLITAEQVKNQVIIEVEKSTTNTPTTR